MANTTQLTTRQKPSLLRILAIVLLTLIVLVGLAVLIFWLIVKPKRLVYSVEDGSIRNFNISNDHLDSYFEFTIRAYNPNKRVSIYYDSIESRVDYDDQTLAYNVVQPFHQPHKNVTRLDVKLRARSTALLNAVSKDLRLERSSGKIELSVVLKARIRFKVGAWKSTHRTLEVFCSPILVHFSKPKSFERTYCDVEL
ncbi:hypothetical protein UlMin_012592 [Ulmus minor]